MRTDCLACILENLGTNLFTLDPNGYQFDLDDPEKLTKELSDYMNDCELTDSVASLSCPMARTT